jgi:hypothetical protein
VQMKSLIKSCCICVLVALSACNPSPPAAPTKPLIEKTPVSTETAFIPSPTETPTENPKKTTFIKTFGDTRRDRGINLIETNDGGFAIVGYTSSFGAGQEDVYLVRTNTYGELLWYRTYGGEGTDNGWDIVQTEDKGFLIVGFTDSFGAGEMDIYLIRTDSDGQMLWERTFGGTKSEYGWALAQTVDGGFVLAGQTDSFGEGDKDGYLVKVDANGDELWSQTYGARRKIVCTRSIRVPMEALSLQGQRKALELIIATPISSKRIALVPSTGCKFLEKTWMMWGIASARLWIRGISLPDTPRALAQRTTISG